MIRVAIAGYGNLGRGVELSINQNPDMELVAVFTRREPETIKIKNSEAKVFHISDVEKMKNSIDVMILCGGSATDLPEQGPKLVKLFNTVDSFDTHARIPEYFKAVDEAAKTGGKVGIISTGWDPGLFSLIRLIGEAILPQGTGYTFWGKGVSQGHSEALRHVKGVIDGIQYTIPIQDAIQKIRSGETPNLSVREKHLRDCYVVAEEGADKAAIEKEIKNMPNYFADYETNVTFISKEELVKNHSGMPHGGFVIHSGKTSEKNNQYMEFLLKLDSNPEFTSSVLVACARAAYRLNNEGQSGAKTLFDIPLGYLSMKSPEQLRKELL